jgi:diguanylate cyclase
MSSQTHISCWLLSCGLWVLLSTTCHERAHALELPVVAIDGQSEGVAIGRALAIYKDEHGKVGRDEILNGKVVFAGPSLAEETPNFGLTRAVYWFQTRLVNTTHATQRLILEIDYAMLDEVDFYTVDEAGRISSSERTGSMRPFVGRTIPHRNFLFPIELEGAQSARLLIRVRSSVGMQLPARLWSQQAFIAHDQSSAILQGVYIGFMIVMLLYNLFLYFSVRDRTYLLYGAMVAGQLWFQCGLHGFSSQWLWPSNPILNHKLGVTVIMLATWSANSFALAFLDVARRDPTWNAVTRVIRAACLVGAVLGPILSFDLGIAISCILAAAAASSVFVAVLRVWNVARRPAAMLGIAWTPLLLGTIGIVIEKFGWVPRNFLTTNLVQIGSAIEVVVLSLALGDRINHERDEKLKAQELALAHERTAQRAQQEALNIQRRANETLEQRVRERTHELAEANERMAEMSTLDALTGLRNRRYFNERFHDEHARAAREGAVLSVLMVDVDHFKSINDTYGHLVGDQCLSAIAEVLRQSVSRATDTVARYGGEEFVIVLPKTETDGARLVAESVRRGVEALSIEAAGELLRLSVSVGVTSRIPERGERRETFLSNADGALYEAKQRGRNRVHVLEVATS